MNLLEFQEQSKRTMPFNGAPSNPIEFENMLGNYAMGLVGEALEFNQAMKNVELYEGLNDSEKAADWSDVAFKEIGDTLHYAVGLLACLGETFDENKLVESEKGGIFVAGDICEIAKKHIYHRHDLDKELLVGKVYDYLSGIIASTGEFLSEILHTNIDKLKTRYPDKFSTENSIARVDVK